MASTADPDKKQMLERLDAAVTDALQPLQAAMNAKAADEVVQPLAQVRLTLVTLDQLSLCDSQLFFFFKDFRFGLKE